MANIEHITSKVNDHRERIKEDNDGIANSLLILTNANNGFLPMIENEYPEMRASTLMKVKPDLYQKMSVLALRSVNNGKTLEIALAPTMETPSKKELFVRAPGNQWPVWVPLDNGPCVRSITLFNIAKCVWKFV